MNIWYFALQVTSIVCFYIAILSFTLAGICWIINWFRIRIDFVVLFNKIKYTHFFLKLKEVTNVFKI